MPSEVEALARRMADDLPSEVSEFDVHCLLPYAAALVQARDALGYAPHLAMSDEGSKAVADARRAIDALLPAAPEQGGAR